jgi:hypothetical protein
MMTMMTTVKEEGEKKIVVFWDVTSYSPVGIYWPFGGMCCFHVRSRQKMEVCRVFL